MTTITVAKVGELKTAIETLSQSGGGTIFVKNTGKNYNFNQMDLGAKDAPIRITAEDPDNPPVFEFVRLINCKNLQFDQVTFNSIGVSRPSWHKDLMLERCSDISVTNSSFMSNAKGTLGKDADAVWGETMGFVRDNTNFEFSGNTVSNYYTGLSIVQTDGITVENNHFTRLQGDGLNGGGMQNAVIKGNHFSDWLGSSKSINHDDMLQIWGTNMDQTSKNVLIEDNFFDAGTGSAPQAILIQNEEWKSAADNYSNITIRDNVFYNGHTHGITVDDTVGVDILNNTLLHNNQARVPSTNSSDTPWIRVYSNEDTVIKGNITTGITAKGADVSGNQIINYDSPSSPNYYAKHIFNLESGGHVDLRDLELRPDSPWLGKFGSAQSQGTDTPDGVSAVMTLEPVPGDLSAFILDARFSHDAGGVLGEKGASYEWHFPDGTVAKDMRVRADFSKPGRHDVTLVVRKADGTTDSITRAVPVADPVVEEISFKDGLNSKGVTFSDLADVPFADGLNGLAFRMDGDSEATLNKKRADFHELDQFSVSVMFSMDGAKSAGKIFDFHRVMSLSVTQDQTVSFSLKTDAGSFNLNSGTLTIPQTGWHHAMATYDSVSGALSLYIDGTKVSSISASGITAPYNHTGPKVGVLNFKDASFVGLIDHFGFYREAFVATDVAKAYDVLSNPGQSNQGDTQPLQVIIGSDVTAPIQEEPTPGPPPPAFKPSIFGTSASDTLYGSATAENILGREAGDKMYGRGGDDFLDGGSGNDRLLGGDGHDTLKGGDLHDVLKGGNGNDTLKGGRHNDILTGEAGADTFVYEKDGGTDRITDFQFGTDKVLLDSALVGGTPLTAAALQNMMQVKAQDIEIRFSGTETLILENVVQDLDAAQALARVIDDISWS